ncbi:ectoine hydroxylase-related dioxygenase (phytanoyl-CoA dioxygenase family) [Kribbella aluminosa]|uniref:Ectoine hydroxylase-related dioxygenase (Phytanoyl-CoA dioxygenase family) n=1 Tax=Kribbella aluminosa TaxID=416017 RepID=A0ABS4UWX3_9ACTN|nr:phytanoyl-CoA dioxygenase family protein [Kribbella aluminosa]MBP2356132.1 ectoine hydroxylase-related dioxygenase (phytanoyl-CoA dioxygenase family) [Kribbella aluminosa]
MTITEAFSYRRATYERDGVVQIDGLLAAAEIDEIRAAFMEQVARDRNAVGAVHEVAGDEILAKYPRFMHPHRRTDLLIGRIARSYLADRRIVDIVTELIGPAWGAQSMFYFKPPSARGQAMHQDNYFLRAHPETCLAAWIAIDDCDAENGALSVVPGSHTMEVVCPDEADAEESFTRGLVRPPAGMEARQTRMRAGDVLFFHGSTVHGSLPNTSADRFRRSLIFHFVPKASQEISDGYLPLLDPDTGEDVTITTASGGGPCGDGWEGGAH